MNKIINIFLIISVLVLSSCTYLPQVDKVKITQIQGQVQFTDTYKPDAAICIPAAYTDKEGKIEGQSQKL